MQTILASTPIAQAQNLLAQSGQNYLMVLHPADPGEQEELGATPGGLPLSDRALSPEEQNQSPLFGIITQRDVALACHYGFAAAPVANHCRQNIQIISPQLSPTEQAKMFAQQGVEYLVIAEEAQPIALVERSQFLNNQPPADFPLPQTRIAPAPWQLLQQLAQAAQTRGWQLYLVGGVVRDLFLSAQTSTAQLQFKDIDLVVDGMATPDQAGVELAQAIQPLYSTAKLTIHGSFQTAALTWEDDPELGHLGVDIATTRTEVYPYPAANPEVSASSIQQDLQRRDFTINALAFCLTEPNAGTLLDFFGGIAAARSRQIQAIHPNSFIEDPTRIFRAVRFAVRLGFRLESATERWIRRAIASGIYEQVRVQQPQAPALTIRLRAELQTIFTVPYWQPVVVLLGDLQAWRCLHPALALTPALLQQLGKLQRGLGRFDPEQALTPWQLCLELLLLQLPIAEALSVAKALQLPPASSDRLAQVTMVVTQIRSWPLDLAPSAIAARLKPQCLELLVLCLVQLPRPQRKLLWRYLSHWSQLKPPLNGHDLQQLGYPRGPQYRMLLNDLWDATLDGKITSRETAIAYLAQQHPLEGEG
ncbi:MAG: hypothetical protein AAGG51_07770 [Cyanobacteria bacterium P01_G01_bin.54]